jgi:PAS domain-containing protein
VEVQRRGDEARQVAALSTQVAVLALNARGLLSPRTDEERLALHGSLEENIHAVEWAFERFAKGDPTRGQLPAMGRDVDRILNNEPHDVHRRVLRLVETARRVAKSSPDGLLSDPSEVLWLHEEATGPLAVSLRVLNDRLSAHQTEAVLRAQRIGQAGGALATALLLAQALFVVRRLVRRVQESATRLVSTRLSLLQADARWKAVFEMSPEAILTVAPDGQIRGVNPAARRLLELGVSDGPGQKLQRYLPKLELTRSKEGEQIEARTARGRNLELHMQARELDEPGSELSYLVSLRPAVSLVSFREVQSSVGL